MKSSTLNCRNNTIRTRLANLDKNQVKELYNKVTQWFSANMEKAESELHYDSAFHLLIAVILSAQCTDKRVNIYTPAIFSRYPEPADLAAASFEEVYELIKSISFPNNKARHLIGMARMLVSDFDSTVPSDVAQLQKLPGVGRKTANVIASVIYGKSVIAVDTHVFRVSRRIGLSDGQTVEAVEKDLTKGFASELLGTAHHWLILHGRYVCTARKPKCHECGLQDFCRHMAEQKRNSL